MAYEGGHICSVLAAGGGCLLPLLFDFCFDNPWCWQWPLDEVWSSKAPRATSAVPPFLLQELRVGERTCSFIPL